MNAHEVVSNRIAAATRVSASALTIRAPELVAVRKDPEFDPALPAIYYARVIQIPTPRWTAYEAQRFKLNLPEQFP